MKLLTLNFLTCARRSCKSSPEAFPLLPKSATLEVIESDIDAEFLTNILPRLEWDALRTVSSALGLDGLKETAPSGEELWAASGGDAQQPQQQDEAMEVERPGEEVKEDADGGEATSSAEAPSELALALHRLLIETNVQEGSLVCQACGHEYAIKEGIANFLLPPHLV